MCAAMRAAATCLSAVLAALALGACGGGSHGGPTTPREEPPTYSATTPLTGIADPSDARDPADERVIRRWAASLRRGDVGRAARLFALPTVAQAAPGRPIVALRTAAQARAFNAALPCGARLLDTEPQRGAVEPGLTVGVLQLTRRPGAACGAHGRTARVGFLFDHGRIARWIRLADPSGAG